LFSFFLKRGKYKSDLDFFLINFKKIFNVIFYFFRDAIYWCHGDAGCKKGDFKISEKAIEIWGLYSFFDWISSSRFSVTKKTLNSLKFEKEGQFEPTSFRRSLNHYTTKDSVIMDKPVSRAGGLNDVYGFQIGFLDALGFDPTSDQNQTSFYDALITRCPSLALPDFDNLMNSVGPSRLQELKEIKTNLNTQYQYQYQYQYQPQPQPEVQYVVQYTPNGQLDVLANNELNPEALGEQVIQFEEPLAPFQPMIQYQVPQDLMDLDLDSQVHDDLDVSADTPGDLFQRFEANQNQAETAKFRDELSQDAEQETQSAENVDLDKLLQKFIESEEIPDLPVSELLKRNAENLLFLNWI
jgi:hypothetical protein